MKNAVLAEGARRIGISVLGLLEWRDGSVVAGIANPQGLVAHHFDSLSNSLLNEPVI